MPIVKNQLASLVTEPYDYISFNPEDQPTTITFKIGGASGSTVATLTLTYNGNDISTITRT